jgi:putative hydrolase of the HAD superfamily
VRAVIDAVLLDVGGVFILPDHELIRPPIEEAGGDGSPAVLDRGHYAGISALDALAELDWGAYHQAVARNSGVPDDRVGSVAEAMRQAMQRPGSWQRLLPGSSEGLRLIAETGVGLGIVSNSDGTVQEQLLTTGICQVGLGLGIPVAIVVDSAVAGFEKPDPRIFALALESLGVPAGRAVHVGDTVFADVLGARAAGVRPLHLDPYGFCPRPAGDHDHVRSLADVADLIVAGREN